MRREGRQHGMVRTYVSLSAPWNKQPEPECFNEVSSPPTAGLFTKVSTKPTNHSKYTSKCGLPKCHRCHGLPATKSKDKTKGTQKNRSSSDMASNHRLITWRVVGPVPSLKISGFSATGVLDYLASDDYMDDHDHEDEYDHDVDESYDRDQDYISDRGVVVADADDDADDDDDDDHMSFCEVGFVWQAVDGDESWCLVEEM